MALHPVNLRIHDNPLLTALVVAVARLMQESSARNTLFHKEVLLKSAM